MNIKYTCFGLVGFYGISDSVSPLMHKPLFTYISYIYDLKTHFVDNNSKWVRTYFLHGEMVQSISINY